MAGIGSHDMEDTKYLHVQDCINKTRSHNKQKKKRLCSEKNRDICLIYIQIYFLSLCHNLENSMGRKSNLQCICNFTSSI